MKHLLLIFALLPRLIVFSQQPVPVILPKVNIQFELPNNKWKPSAETDPTQGVYFYKREPVTDAHHRSIIPAIMLFVEDAGKYRQDVVEFSTAKQLPFQEKGLNIEQTLIHTDKDYPLSYTNGMFMKCSYSQNGLEHRLYMIHIIDKHEHGIQLYLDMTKDLGAPYENELLAMVRSFREK